MKAHSRPAPLGVVAIVRVGGTITHHHGVGEDHVPWLGAEKGAQGLGLLRAIKREMDPAGRAQSREAGGIAVRRSSSAKRTD